MERLLSDNEETERQSLAQEQGLVLSARQYLKSLTEGEDFLPSVQDFLERGRDLRKERRLNNARKNAQLTWREPFGGGSLHHFPNHYYLKGLV